jgi:hypothetical protein
MKHFSFLHHKVSREAEIFYLRLIGEYSGMEVNARKYRILFFPLLKDGSLGQIKVESKGYHTPKPGTGDSVLLSPLTMGHWRRMFDYRAPNWIRQIREILTTQENQSSIWVWPLIYDNIRAIDNELENIHGTLISNGSEMVDLRLYARRFHPYI